MDRNDLKVQYFNQALRLASKGLFLGAIAVNVSFLIATNTVSAGDAKIPISGISIPNKEIAIAVFMFVYFLCGLLTLFAVARAEHILNQIDDQEIQKIVVMQPSLLTASLPVRWIATLIVLGASWMVFSESYSLNIWQCALLGTLSGSPFGIAFQYGKGIKNIG